MATVALPGRADAVSPLRLFTSDEYDEMLRVGILREGEALELLGGLICEKMPKSAEHMAAKTRTHFALSRALPPGWHAVSEDAVLISAHDQPEPDVIVRRGELPDYDRRKATADDIALLVEVSVTSLNTDRGVKLRAYAAAAVPTYWIINLNTRRVEVYTAPHAGHDAGYAVCEERGETDWVDLVIEGQVVGQIAVASLLPAVSDEPG
jgi:Uma2 family endonuclease